MSRDIHGRPEPEPVCPGCDELEQKVQALEEEAVELNRRLTRAVHAYNDKCRSMKLLSVSLVGGQVIFAHPREICDGETCCIHNPSDHKMIDWPQNWREDTQKMERLCPHGIGHPDPDELEWLGRVDPASADWRGIHGCDGCC